LLTISIKVNVPQLQTRSLKEQGTFDEEANPIDPGLLELAARQRLDRSWRNSRLTDFASFGWQNSR
jgi:hypothetical protein